MRLPHIFHKWVVWAEYIDKREKAYTKVMQKQECRKCGKTRVKEVR